jgi:hypothetical protein
VGHDGFAVCPQGCVFEELDSPKTSTSEDENELPPSPGEDSLVQVMTGDGFQMDQDREESVSAPADWTGHAPTMAEQIRQQQQEKLMRELIPDWMTPADRHILDIAGLHPLPWKTFSDAIRIGDEKEFAILEHRRFEQCFPRQRMT